MTTRESDLTADMIRDLTRPRVRLVVVTDSELSTWRACPQLHHFQYRERLRPLIEAKALAIGTIVHAGIRSGLLVGWRADDTRTISQRVADQIAASALGVDDRVAKWASQSVRHGSEVDWQRLLEDVEETATMVKWMLRHYFETAKQDLIELELVETEMPFEVAMRDAKERPVSHLRYAGVRDAVYYDPLYNQLVLDEHKTSGGDPRAIERRVEMDTQTAGYLHAIREQHRFGTPFRTVTGREVPVDAGIGRVRYNVLRKTYPEPPKVNKDGSVSVAMCTTTVEMYEAALEEQEKVRGKPRTDKQVAFLEALVARGDQFFARVEWHRTKPEVERWRSDAFVDASRIRAADRDPSHRTRNVGHCNMPWSLPCSYRSVCLDPSAPEIRQQFRVVEDQHAEVRSAETEIP